LFDLSFKAWKKVVVKTEKDLGANAHIPLRDLQMHTMTAVVSLKNHKENYQED